MKKTIKSLLRSFGFELSRYGPQSNVHIQILAALNYVQSNVIFDIGANEGQFAQELRSIGFSGKIISFDPLSSAHRQLILSSQNDPHWVIHPRAALGDYDGEVQINIAGNSVSSSILPMLDTHSLACAASAYVSSETSPMSRLDSISSQYLCSDSRVFIKIDTQGFEWQVLDGALDTLKRAQGVLLEISLVPLYSGQKLWHDIINRMENDGFTLWSIQKGFTDPHSGRTLQLDAIFLRQ